MNLGQLIEYNRNIFLQKIIHKMYYCRNYGLETILRPFSKNIKIEHISESIV